MYSLLFKEILENFSLSKLNIVKVFADYHENHEEFDKKVSFSVERVKGIKLLRKYNSKIV